MTGEGSTPSFECEKREGKKQISTQQHPLLTREASWRGKGEGVENWCFRKISEAIETTTRRKSPREERGEKGSHGHQQGPQNS